MSGNLLDQWEAAQAKADRLKREIAASDCRAVGCDMQSYGGANAGCGDHCNCSVPVNVCARCGDCDYGQNAEGDETRRRCAEDDPS